MTQLILPEIDSGYL